MERLLSSAVHETKPNRMKVIGDIFKAAIKLAKESPGTLNLKITATVLKELRYSFKMFYPHRYTPKITIFGSARVPSGTPLYDLAKRFAMEAVKRKYMVITGGGPGIMAAGNEGAEAKGGFGLNIRLPMEQSANPFIDPERGLIHYKYFFTRKLFLVKEASAFCFFPGGFGTFDEACEVLTLVQTGKTSMIPIVMVEPEGFGFWTGWLEFMEKTVLKLGFISATDKALYRLFHTPAEALDHIDFFYKNYHSMRFVKEKAVIRIKKPLPAAAMKKMNKEFGFLSLDGKIVESMPLPEESNEPELKDLPRLVFPFDKKDYGSIRRLIDFINEHTV
jgi:uncharacterized protein (TIGR00730 family)